MSFKIFDSVSYGHMEPKVPFTLVQTFNTLKEAVGFLQERPDELYYVCDEEGKILFDSVTKIYESPDGGKTVYQRNILQNNKERIK